MTLEFIIDSREPQYIKEVIPTFFKEMTNLDINFKIDTLKTGDFKCGKLLIERKEINDFCSSIKEQRLTIQKMKLCMAIEDGYHPYVLIHGSLHDVWQNGLSKRAYAGMIASLNEHGIHTINIEQNDITLVCETIYALIRKHNEEKILKPVWIEPDGSTWTERALRCIPKIGVETAHNIVTQYSPHLQLFYQRNPEQLKNDLIEVEGVGTKLAEKIVEHIYEGNNENKNRV